eukprot:scaffold40995_cov39-Tisochrysis_lutea.AAC.2
MSSGYRSSITSSFAPASGCINLQLGAPGTNKRPRASGRGDGGGVCEGKERVLKRTRERKGGRGERVLQREDIESGGRRLPRGERERETLANKDNVRGRERGKGRGKGGAR